MTTFENKERKKTFKNKAFKDININSFFYNDYTKCLCFKFTKDAYVMIENFASAGVIVKSEPDTEFVCVNASVTWERVYDDN